MVDTGALGGVLSDVGLGLMQGLMGPSWDEEKAARERKARSEEAKIKLDEAQAAYQLRRRQQQPVIKTKRGDVYTYNEDLDKYELFAEAPPTEPKPDDWVKEQALKGLEAKLKKPRASFTYQDLISPDPEVRELWDFYHKRSDILGTGQGPYMKSDVRGAPAPAASGASAPAGTTEPKAPAPPPATPGKLPAQAGAVFLGKATPEMESAIAEAHRLYPEVRPELIRAIMARESSFNPYVRSRKGAEGLMQLMPATGKEMGVTDPFDVTQNIIGGTRYLAQMLKRYGGSELMALAAYNAGPGRMDAAGRQLAKLPPETQVYVPWVLARAGTPEAKATPPATGTPEPGATTMPGATAPAAATAPGTPQPPAGSRVVNPRIVSDEQLREQERKAEDQRLQREQSARDEERLQIAREAEKRNARGAGTNNEQNAVANRLYVEGQVDSPTYNDNRNPAHKKLIDDEIARPKLEKEGRDKAAAEREQRRLELAEERAQRQQKIDLTGPVTADQAAITNKLFTETDPTKRVKERHYALLDPEDQEKVNKEIREPKLRKEHLEALKQAQPMLDELAMLENTQYLTRQIIPLLKRANVGLGGKVTNFSNWAWSNMPGYKAGYLKKAEEQITKEGLGPSLDKALEDARATAMMEGSDPGLMHSLYYTGGRSRLETLVALLMYSHAMAQKRIGAGTARGITTEDMKEARALFDPSEFFATPDKMYEKLVTLQQTIQRGKTRKEEEVRSYHIDPKTKNLVLKSYYQEGASPADAEPAPVTTPDAAAERVRRGPTRKKE